MGFSLGNAFGSVSIDVSGVVKATNSANDSLQSMDKSFLDIAGPVAAAQIAVEAFGAGLQKAGEIIESVVEGMIGGNRQFEVYETSFKVLLGTTELAQDRMQELADFGAHTPFELPGVVEADRTLQSFGLHAPDVAARYGQSAEEIRTISGDVAAGVGISMQEMATYIGKFSAGATGEAIARFQELGIVSRAELEAMGLEFSKSGELVSPLDEATTVLLQLMQEKFGGMMDAQSGTLDGMLSNLVDWKDNTLREMGEPIFDVLKEKLQQLLDFLGSPAAAGVLEEFTSLIRNSMNLLMDFINSFSGGGLTAAVESFTSGLSQVNSFLTELRDRLAGFTVGDVMAELVTGIKDVKDRVKESLDDLEANYQRTVTQINGHIENAQAAFAETMDQINTKYAEKAAKVEEQYANARKKIEQSLADAKYKFEEQLASKRQALQDKLQSLAEKFSQTQQKINQQISEAQATLDDEIARRREQLEEKLTGMAQKFAEKRRAIEEKIADEIYSFEEKREAIQEELQGKIEGLEEKHTEKRAKLSEELGQAQTGEERAAIQAQIDELDAGHKAQIDKLNEQAKKEEQKLQEKHDRAVAKLKERLAREEAAYNDQVSKEQQRAAADEKRTKEKHEKAVGKLKERLAQEEAAYQQESAKTQQRAAQEEAQLQASYDRNVEKLNTRLAEEDAKRGEQLGKIQAQKQAEVDAAQAAHDQQLAQLQERLAAEAAAYAENQATIRAKGDEEIAAMQEAAAARAAALGEEASGPMAQVLEIIDKIKYAADKLGEAMQWIKDHSEEIKGAFIAIGAVLAAAGIAAAIAGIAAAIAALATPMGVLIAASALLGAAWAGNWFGIRDTVIQAWTAMQPAIQTMTEKVQAFWSWITATAIPTLQSWGQSFATGLGPHLDSIAEKLRQFYDEASPKLESAYNKLMEIGGQLAEFYNATLKPALEALAEKFGLSDVTGDGFFKTLGDLVGWMLEVKVDQIINNIENALDALVLVLDLSSTALEKAGNWVDFFKNAWDGIGEKIGSATDALNDWINGSEGMDSSVPSIFTPGSPTPFEIGMHGVAEALRSAAAAAGNLSIPDLSNFAPAPNLPAAAGGAGGGISPEMIAAAMESLASGGTNLTINFNGGNGGPTTETEAENSSFLLTSALRRRGLLA